MTHKFYTNGFLVQNIDKINSLFNIFDAETREKIFSEYKTNYIMGYETWPLYGNKKYKKLNDFLDNLWFVPEPPYNLEVITDIELLYKYIDYCRQENKNIRVLLICTDRDNQITDLSQLKNIKLKFSGYDYIESNCNYSYTLGNLSMDNFLNRSMHLNNINKYGLFKDEDSLEKYITDLYKIYDDKDFYFLTMFDMCRAKIYQIDFK